MGMRNDPCFVLSLFFFCFCFNNHLSLASDTISANHSLSGDETIVSAGGLFELGFCKPGKSSARIYICTRYKKIPTHDIVWVANRETLISDKNSSELKIIGGNLVLLNESKIPVWSTNQNSTTSNSVVAVLLDDGNLVLRDIYGINSKEPIWQSFDDPAHRWLPGGRITYNKRTKTSTTYTSWKNSEDPAPGLFSAVLDGSSNQVFLLSNGSVHYWTSGPWSGEIFSLVPEMRGTPLFNFRYVENENESCLIISLANPSVISRFILDISGQFRVDTWVDDLKEWNILSSLPRQQCEVYAFCGPFGTCNENALPFCNCLTGFNTKSDKDWKLNDYSGGCVRRARLAACGGNSTSVANQERDEFMVFSNVKLPKNPQPVTAGSAKECESACLKNCSCTAFAFEGSVCSIWIGGLLNLKQLSDKDANGKTLNLRLAASEFRMATNNERTTIGGVVGSVGGVLLFVASVFVTSSWMRRRGLLRGITKSVEGSLVAFAYKDLQIATKNFSEKLGEGSFGSVFKGVLSDSTAIAVKRLESINQGEKQFRTEVSTIGNIQHVNLVRLRGFCSQGKNKLLVYDYMQKGSLNSHLFPNNGSEFLDWKTRYKIALETARGLAYLHEKCRDYIIHCDIKPENILLDAEFCPKIADFGLAKLFGREFSKVMTTMRGTIGYIAPEWISGVAIIVKVDVYSYGMILFEFISGRRNTEQFEKGRFRFFPSWAASVVIEGGDVLDLLDSRLEIGNIDVKEVRRICRVACWCVLDDENQRPTMGQVVQTLEGILDLEPPPNLPRFFQDFLDDQDDYSHGSHWVCPVVKSLLLQSNPS